MKSSGTNLSEYLIRNFNKGTVTRVEDYSIPDGAASDSINWSSLGDHIELRGGRSLMGANVATPGNISGLIVAERFDGVQVAVRSRMQKFEYYDTATDLWIESTTTDVLPVAASGEDIAFDKYHSLAGAYIYASSKNSSIYKIPIANPESVVDLSSTDHRGKFRIKNGRIYLWDNKTSVGGFDQTGLYGSWIDKDQLSDYTAIAAESLDASGPTTWTGTLDFKAVDSKRTCMYVSITGTVSGTPEIFRDTRNGTLLSNLGSTGTINYATGAYSVTFSGAVTGTPTADYYWEMSSTQGIADFSFSTPRTAGQGFVIRQDDGGSTFQGLFSIDSDEYCLHTKKSWRFTISSDDLDASSTIYRDKVGIPNWRAACETGDGIYYVDAIDGSEPFVRKMAVGDINPAVIPKSISDNLILSSYRFDTSVVFEWGVYILIACRTANSTTNNRLILYHTLWQSYDFYDYRCSTLGILNGALIAGDSASQNVFTLFSGLTDEDVEIPNFWESGQHDLKMSGTKYTNIFRLKGLIQNDQAYDVEFSYDNGAFVKVGEISGDGDYVDHTQRVTVGPLITGSTEVGGGSGGIEASPYEREFDVNTPVYERVRVRFTATKVGYVSISEYGFKDNRKKSKRGARQYVVN